MLFPRRSGDARRNLRPAVSLVIFLSLLLPSCPLRCAAAADIVPPGVVGTMPADGDCYVLDGTQIWVVFSEPVRVGDSAAFDGISVTDETGNPWPVKQRSIWAPRYSADDTRYLHIELAEAPAKRTYRVVLPAGCVEDLSGNRLPAAYSFSFSTRSDDREPPVVLGVDPPDGAGDVPQDVQIRVTFSEPLMSSDVQLVDADGRPVSGECCYETVGGRGIVTFVPAGWLAPNTAYAVRILSGRVKDEAGNPLMENFTTVFRTGEKALGRGPTGRGSWYQQWRQVQADGNSSVYEVSLPGEEWTGLQFVLLGSTRSAGEARTDWLEVALRDPQDRTLATFRCDRSDVEDVRVASGYYALAEPARVAKVVVKLYCPGGSPVLRTGLSGVRAWDAPRSRGVYGERTGPTVVCDGAYPEARLKVVAAEEFPVVSARSASGEMYVYREFVAPAYPYDLFEVPGGAGWIPWRQFYRVPGEGGKGWVSFDVAYAGLVRAFANPPAVPEWLVSTRYAASVEAGVTDFPCPFVNSVDEAVERAKELYRVKYGRELSLKKLDEVIQQARAWPERKNQALGGRETLWATASGGEMYEEVHRLISVSFDLVQEALGNPYLGPVSTVCNLIATLTPKEKVGEGRRVVADVLPGQQVCVWAGVKGWAYAENAAISAVDFYSEVGGGHERLGVTMGGVLFYYPMREPPPEHARLGGTGGGADDGRGTCRFGIGRNYYEAGGQRFPMDAAPYVKDGRSYVPVRYLAYALGVPEEGVRWDGAAQAVTLRKGDVILRLTLGSPLMERQAGGGPRIALVMDVTPELVADRVFLPARYVAAGLGYLASWEPATRQVTLAPGAIAWPEDLVFDPNPVEPGKGLRVLVRSSGPASPPVVRLRGVGGPGEQGEYWRQRDSVTLSPGGPGEWVVGCVSPGRAGVYPVEVTVGGFTFTAERWLLKVYPEGFLEQPGYAAAEEAVRARFARDFPGCVLGKVEPRGLLPEDGRDPRYHGLFMVTFYQPYDGPVLPAGTHSYFYYVVKDGPAGAWRVLAGGSGP